MDVLERGRSANVIPSTTIREYRMHRNLRFATLILAAFACATASAGAQAAQQGAARNRGVVEAPPSPPPVAVAPTTGINTSGHNQPGVPNTSTPGIIGTGGTPSGMRGDSTTAPGFPATTGR